LDRRSDRRNYDRDPCVLWRGRPSNHPNHARRSGLCFALRGRSLHAVISRPGVAPTTIGFLIVCLALVLAFEFSNGFHDTANAVATVIYTNSLKPLYAVVWSGLMNFLGVLLGGIAVAYALVQLIPPEVLSPPNGGTAVGMLVALFIAALVWNVGTWWLGLPNSSSHALIGALIGIAIGNSIKHARGFGNGVDWSQVKSVLSALLFSPNIGFVLAFILFRLLKLLVHDKRLYKPPEGDKPPVW